MVRCGSTRAMPATYGNRSSSYSQRRGTTTIADLDVSRLEGRTIVNTWPGSDLAFQKQAVEQGIAGHHSRYRAGTESGRLLAIVAAVEIAKGDVEAARSDMMNCRTRRAVDGTAGFVGN